MRHRYGNYHRYYGYRLKEAFDDDPRLKVGQGQGRKDRQEKGRAWACMQPPRARTCLPSACEWMHKAVCVACLIQGGHGIAGMELLC